MPIAKQSTNTGSPGVAYSFYQLLPSNSIMPSKSSEYFSPVMEKEGKKKQ
jgi:hypothetical protein